MIRAPFAKESDTLAKLFLDGCISSGLIVTALGCVLLIPLVLAQLISFPVALALVATSLLTSFALRWFWLMELAQVGAWIRKLSEGDEILQGPEVQDSISRHVLSPIRVLARRLHESELRATANKAQVERLANGLPDPIMFINSSSEIAWCNEPAKRAFDIIEENTLLGRCVRDPDFLSAIAAVREHGHSVQTPFVRPQMPEVRYSARIEPMQFQTGELGLLVAVREESEALLIERMRSDFVANASHEMRTPLTAMNGIVETLLTSAKNDPEAREMFLGIMADETKRMTRLVDDLLSLSRIEAESQETVTEECSLDELIQQAANIMQTASETSGIELIVRIKTPDVSFIGDRDQLHQVVCNLVENAIKYGGAKKRVWLGADLVSHAPEMAGALAGRSVIMISIEDEGGGMEAHHLSRLAERFYRIDRARSRASGGTGLGLAIVKHILRRHSGFMAIESELGKGSKFTVFLPA